MYWNSSYPGMSRERLTTRASCASSRSIVCSLPLLPLNWNRSVAPLISTCRSRIVREAEAIRLSRAYSSLPTRINVVSSRRTTAASTFSRGSPSRDKSRCTRLRSAAARGRRRSSARTSSRRAPPASACDNGIACGRVHPGPSPGCDRSRSGRSRRRPRGRDRELPEALYPLTIPDGRAVQADVRKALAGALAADAGRSVGDIAESSLFGCLNRVDNERRFRLAAPGLRASYQILVGPDRRMTLSARGG